MVCSKDRNPAEFFFELVFIYDCAVGNLLQLPFPSCFVFDSLHIFLPFGLLPHMPSQEARVA